MTKVFFDTEFTGLHKNTTLISIGLVTEFGDRFYAELTDYDHSQIDDWLQQNVINNLLGEKSDNEFNTPNWYHKGDTTFIADKLKTWLESIARKYNNKIEMWTDCGAYDWMLFCDLWKHAFNIPDCVYYIWFDLCTLLKVSGVDPDISREELITRHNKTVDIGLKHNAIYDALVIKECYDILTSDGLEY